jgi:hypothetical protein
MNTVIMAVVWAEAPVCLQLPSPIIGALGPSAASSLFGLPTAFVSLLPPPKQTPAHGDGVVVPLRYEPGTCGGRRLEQASLSQGYHGRVVLTWPQGVPGAT